MKKMLLPILMAILMVFPMIPMAAAPVSAQTDNGTVVMGDTLNGIKVRFRPAGSHKPLSINQEQKQQHPEKRTKP